jgi:uncharacterized protein YjbJ (UPF0337 family)
MTKLREKAQGRTKQIVGQMIGDDELVHEGKEQERDAGKEAENETASSSEPAQAASSQD